MSHSDVRVPRSRGQVFFVVGTGVVAAIAVAWLLILLSPVGNKGSLDARALAVGEQVRCPSCPEAISVNDVQNAQAVQMRQYIRSELRRGISEQGVLSELAASYGATILLSPPLQGFTTLAWAIPVVVIVLCAIGLLVVARRWSRTDSILHPDSPLATPDWQHYEERLDQELAQRE